jgi:hypothetical protein
MATMLPEQGEYLTTGWEPDLDPADSVIRQGIDAHVSWARALTEAARGRFVERPGWCAGSGGTTTALLNLVVVRQPPSDWSALVEDVCTAYQGPASFMVLSPFPTPDLSGLGLGLVGHPPFMMRPAVTVTEPPSTALEVASATTAQQLRDAERVFVDGYPLPDMADLPPGEFYRPEVAEGPTRVFVAYDEGMPVATSAAHSAAGVTIVENVAVLAAARGKGAGAAVTWAATSAWPQQPAVLVASDDGQPVYERLGFLRLVRWTCWIRP